MGFEPAHAAQPITVKLHATGLQQSVDKQLGRSGAMKQHRASQARVATPARVDALTLTFEASWSGP